VYRAIHWFVYLLNSISRLHPQNQQIYLRGDLSIPETISNVKASQGARKLTAKLLPVFESSPVAILETDNSTSFSFPLCAFCIFYSTTLAQSFPGIGRLSGNIPLLSSPSQYIGICKHSSSGLVDPPALQLVPQPSGSNAVPEDARELQLQDLVFKESVEVSK